VRRSADDLDEIAVRLERKSRYAEKGLDLDEIGRLERKSRYAEKGLLIEHETEW